MAWKNAEKKKRTYVRCPVVSRCLWLKSFTEWSFDMGKQREGRGERGVEEEYADPSKDEREVQRRLRKPVSVRDNRGASD